MESGHLGCPDHKSYRSAGGCGGGGGRWVGILSFCARRKKKTAGLQCQERQTHSRQKGRTLDANTNNSDANTHTRILRSFIDCLFSQQTLRVDNRLISHEKHGSTSAHSIAKPHREQGQMGVQLSHNRNLGQRGSRAVPTTNHSGSNVLLRTIWSRLKMRSVLPRVSGRCLRLPDLGKLCSCH